MSSGLTSKPEWKFWRVSTWCCTLIIHFSDFPLLWCDLAQTWFHMNILEKLQLKHLCILREQECIHWHHFLWCSEQWWGMEAGAEGSSHLTRELAVNLVMTPADLTGSAIQTRSPQRKSPGSQGHQLRRTNRTRESWTWLRSLLTMVQQHQKPSCLSLQWKPHHRHLK